MHPSEMTDKQLQLAIAEMLGWKYSPDPVREFSDGNSKRYDYISLYWTKLQRKVAEEPGGIPNYPGDIEAAMEVLIRKVYGYILTDKSITIQTNTHGEISKGHYNTLESIARAISEVAYMALIAERGK